MSILNFLLKQSGNGEPINYTETTITSNINPYILVVVISCLFVFTTIILIAVISNLKKELKEIKLKNKEKIKGE